MLFTVTYREKGGAKAEMEIAAASRAECFAQMKARGIAPMSVREGRSSSRPRAAGTAVPHAGRAKPRSGMAWRAAILAATCLAAGIGAWWWLGREALRPASAEKPARPKAAKPQPAPKHAAKPAARSAVTNAEPTAVAQPPKPALKDLPPEKRDEYIAKKILENPPDLSPSTNRTFKTGVEQVASWIFTTRLGDTPPPLPRISIRDKAHIRAILDAKNPVNESDSERVADVKQTVEHVKKLLDEYISKGGDVQDFFAYYHGQLKEAHNIWRQNQINMMKVLKEEPEAAPALIDAMNTEMAEKGIKPLMIPPKYRKQLGLE